MDKKNLETSIIIRTKNEERYLEHVLLMLKKQTYKNFETVIVDDNSTDKTLEIAKKYNCKIVKIPEGKFNYPYACNFGIRESIGEYIVFISGHSIPINTKWLENGLTILSMKRLQEFLVIDLCTTEYLCLKIFCIYLAESSERKNS